MSRFESGRVPNSHSVPKGHAAPVVMHLVDKIYETTPGFTDVFDEDSFYLFAVIFTLLTFLGAFAASRFVTIKARD